MAGPSRAGRTLFDGPFGTVEYAVRSDGVTMEAKEWLEAQPKNTQASFAVLFDRLVNQGRIHNIQHFRRLKNDIWEFKRKGDRILCFVLGKRWLLTHRIKKAGGLGKCPPSAIKHADMIGEEHIAWETKHNQEKRRKDDG